MNRRRSIFVVLSALALAASSCGGKAGKGAASAAGGFDLDADPLALLPASPVAVASVDAKALFTSPSVGPQIAALADELVPLTAAEGFDAKRDVDRVVAGSYAQTGDDVAAIVSGRFDEAKLGAATKTKKGAPITKTLVAGVATYASGHAAWAVLTAKTLVAGSLPGVQRVLARIHDAAGAPIARSEPAWMLDVLQTPGAQLAVASDFSAHPMGPMAVGPLKLAWTEGMRKAQGTGKLEPPGLRVAGTLVYGSAEQAQAAVEGIQGMSTMLKLVGPLLGGVSVQDLSVSAMGSEVAVKAATDDKTLGKLLELAPRYVPEAR